MNDSDMATQAAQPIRVALVDDQQLVRSGFRMLIGSQPDLQVVAEAGDGAAAIEVVRGADVDVVLMDIRMPGMDGIAATERLVASPGGSVKVIVLTTFDLDEYVLAAIRAGASGFLLKDAPPEDLLDAIRTVHRGDAVIAPSMTRRLLAHVVPLLVDADSAAQRGAAPTASGAAPADLTPREVEVLRLLAQGMSNAEIATGLFLSEATVKTHVAHILAKTNSRDRVQAVVFAFENGLASAGNDHPQG